MTDKVSPAPLQTPTREQIEAFRKEHHIPGVDDLEPWAVEENMVLAYLCSQALLSSERTEQRGEQQVASDAGASGASPDSPHQSERGESK